MIESSSSIVERSRQNESAILRALAATTQASLAAAIGVHESTVSKMTHDGSIEKTSTFLAAAGLKLVPASAKFYEPDYIASLQTLAARCIEIEKGGAA